MNQFVLAVLFFGLIGLGGQVWARAGSFCQLICASPMVTVNGVVADIQPGNGYVIDTGEEQVTVYGFGPVWFWSKLGVSKPGIGDEISVTAYEVSFSYGSTKLIAGSVDMGDQTITLRDAETCVPMWIKR